MKKQSASLACRVLPPSPEQISFIETALNLSTEEFAAFLGVQRSSLSYWKTGEHVPNSKSALDLWILWDFPEVKKLMHHFPHMGVKGG